VLKLVLILSIFLNSFPKCAENPDVNSGPSTVLSNAQLASKNFQIIRPFSYWFPDCFSMKLFGFQPFSLIQLSYSATYSKFISSPYAFMHLVGTVW
jgi:hypothetical protein